MGIPNPAIAAKKAVFAISEIKVAVDDFDRGDTNVFHALERIFEALEDYRLGSEFCRDVA